MGIGPRPFRPTYSGERTPPADLTTAFPAVLTFVLFDPPLAPGGSVFAPGGLSASDFAIGEFDKGRDGRGLPGAQRRLWLAQVRTAVIHLAWTIKDLPEAEIDGAKESGKVFNSVTVIQAERRVLMRAVKIERFTRYLNEPRKIYLNFHQLTLLPR